MHAPRDRLTARLAPIADEQLLELVGALCRGPLRALHERLPRERLLEALITACASRASTARLVDTHLASVAPLPSWAVDRVLLSTDLISRLLDTLQLEDSAAATVCKAWSVGWEAKTRDFMREAPDHGWDVQFGAPAAAPLGEQLFLCAPDGVIQVLDKRLVHQCCVRPCYAGAPDDGLTVNAAVAGAHGLYVAGAYRGHVDASAALHRLTLDGTFTTEARYAAAGCAAFFEVAAAGELLFATAAPVDASWEPPVLWATTLLALDSMSLEVRYTLGAAFWNGAVLVGGLAVCGEELFVCTYEAPRAAGLPLSMCYDPRIGSPSIRVLSLDGTPRRTIAMGGWVDVQAMCGVAGRLYLIEYEMDWDLCGDRSEWLPCSEELFDAWSRARDHGPGKPDSRVFVLSPEGEVLDVFVPPKPADFNDDNVWEHSWRHMCHFDGKLVLLASEDRACRLVGIPGAYAVRVGPGAGQ